MFGIRWSQGNQVSDGGCVLTPGGVALFEATAVGPESRAAQLAATARAFRHPLSPLGRATDRLLLWLIADDVRTLGLVGNKITSYAQAMSAS